MSNQTYVPPPFYSRVDLSNPPVFGYSAAQAAAMAQTGSLPWEIDEYRDTWPTVAPVKDAAKIPPKQYLEVEETRNKAVAQLFIDLVRVAYGLDDNVVVGHHISFLTRNDLKSLNEIPSADTAIFDHALMGNVFGDMKIKVMQRLATFPADTRDAELQRLFDARDSLTDSIINAG